MSVAGTAASSPATASPAVSSESSNHEIAALSRDVRVNVGVLLRSDVDDMLIETFPDWRSSFSARG
jgi:hypothetical protein